MSDNKDYLRFSATSMKDYIKRKLSEDTNFTDHLFEGSNLSVFVDVFSYMYNMMSYYLNNTASEAVFDDSKLFENMNRIVKMIGYDPLGFQTPSVEVLVSGGEDVDSMLDGVYFMPKYTTFDMGITDADGNPIKYTLIDNHKVKKNTVDGSAVIINDDPPIFYNGTWKLYPSIEVSTGIPFETFTLSEISMLDESLTISHNHIDIMVKKADDTFVKFTQTEEIESLFDYGPTDNVYDIRLNEDKTYEIKFGNGINGKRLDAGDNLFIIYLQSNGVDGQIAVDSVPTSAKFNVSIVGLTTLFIQTNIFQVNNAQTKGYLNFWESGQNGDLPYIVVGSNPTPSTNAYGIESVADIRENAPNWFEMGGSLNTAKDFDTYISRTFGNRIQDVKVHNNFKYMADFQSWLHSIKKEDGSSYLTTDIRTLNYNFSDSCDFNNIYLWMKSSTVSALKSSETKTMIKDMDRFKPTTSELIALDPLYVNFAPYVSGYETDGSGYELANWDTLKENSIYVIRDQNTVVADSRIRQQVVDTITDYFKLENNKLGQTIDFNDIYNKLLQIEGVSGIKTRYLADGDSTDNAVFHNGLKFAMWTDVIVNGDDFTVLSGNTKLRDFQFPTLTVAKDLIDRVLVKSNEYNITEIEY